MNVLGLDDVAIAQAARRAGIALKTAELRAIAERLGRDLTLVEAHAFDAQWSEHCSYKSSRAYLSRLPTEGPSVMLGPKEDAGIVRLGEWNGETYGIVVAHESHNHPSQVVPFEGAATGIGGIVRDVLCMGARVIAVADPLRFGPLDDPHCRYVAQGVVDGIAAYGNAIGVPNIAGDVYFHDGFRDNCLVNVLALGLVKEREIIHSAAPPESEGWDIVLVGKATDRSGFGGAAFSSLVLDEEDAEANKGAVQVPDPFLKNVIMRATYRAFDVIVAENISVGFKDLGAGGIMGCTAELVASGGFGATLDLDRCPTSQPDLPAAVIAVGETQERLAWVVPPHFTSRLLAIYNDEFSLPEIARGAQAAIVGRVERSPDYVLRRHGAEVMRVPIDFLTSGIRYERACVAPIPIGTTQHHDFSGRHAELLARVLAHRDVCSRRPIYERYDSVVRGATSIPCGYADAGVLVPVPGAPLGVALGLGGNPRYGALDPRLAGEYAVCEAIRNVAAVGGVPAGLTDCLNFGNPEDPRQFGEFVAAVDGIAQAARELGVPFVSGNVSLYNQSATGNGVPASPIVGCVGTFADVSIAVTSAFKRAGSTIFFLGRHSNGIAGRVVAELLGYEGGAMPVIDYEALRRELGVLRQAFDRGLVLAAHDISDGGLLVALAEMCFGSRLQGLGVEIGAIGLNGTGHREALFGEPGGFVVEVTEPVEFRRLASALACPVVSIGTTTQDSAIALFPRTPAEERLDLAALHAAWSAPLQDFYAGAAS
ncbi:MAG: phosphoribosylformylglycinamidine synthase subunit PurL [Candidatus Baltobacteraceae bacterium]